VWDGVAGHVCRALPERLSDVFIRGALLDLEQLACGTGAHLAVAEPAEVSESLKSLLEPALKPLACLLLAGGSLITSTRTEI